jgi:mRNA-degrading endonuclease RelE of RelBE toxin-antitoxin system
MSIDPFQADVKALRGPAWKGVFRRRIGDYRMLFTTGGSEAHPTVTIVRILARSEDTYK